MNALGIVVEYNPFHNGHAFHIEESKKSTGADVVIAVMSGNFLQRGEPAIVSKWSRTRMALLSGVDVVFELPYPFAVQQADTFAFGAVALLEAAGCSYLSFGSEEGKIDPFLDTYSFMKTNKEEYDQVFKEINKEGYSYPRARSLAFKRVAGEKELLDLSKPNNILGLQYVQSAIQNSYSIKPYTIKRVMANYHDASLGSQPIASATSIRKALFEKEGSIDTIKNQIPLPSKEELNDYFNQYNIFHNWELYWPLLQYRIISSSLSELNNIYEMEEGLEHRFKAIAPYASSFYDFIDNAKTKRYTWTRLQRASLHILTNLAKETMAAESIHPSYLRLLGMTKKGRTYLNEKKKIIELPIITKPSSFKDMLKTDLHVSAIYSLPLKPLCQASLMKREYQPPILLEDGKEKH